MVRERIEEFRGFGGVRIEDDIIITETGLEMMSIVPREVHTFVAIDLQSPPVTVILWLLDTRHLWQIAHSSSFIKQIHVFEFG